MAQFADGKRNPWTTTLDEVERFTCFKALADARGARYAASTLETYVVTAQAQRDVLAKLRAIQRDGLTSLREGGGLILYGPQGTGKDHLQFAMLRHAILKWGYSAAWRDGLRLQDEVRRAIGDGKESELRETLRESQILAISDPLPPIGELNQWNLSFIRDVIDRRYQDLKSTWITFNGTTLDDLKPILTPPLAARIVDQSIALNCSWPSHRKPATI